MRTCSPRCAGRCASRRTSCWTCGLNREDLSEEERQLIARYRSMPSMQPAVRILLGMGRPEDGADAPAGRVRAADGADGP